MFYAIIDYQLKTSELKNVEKLVKQTVQALKPYQNTLGMCIYVRSVKLYSYLVVPKNLMWALKSPLKELQFFVWTLQRHNPRTFELHKKKTAARNSSALKHWINNLSVAGLEKRPVR